MFVVARTEKNSISLSWVVSVLGALLGMLMLSARGSAQFSDVQSYIEEKANLVLSQRLDPKLFVVYVTVDASAEAPVTDKKVVDLPFSPFKVDAKLLTDGPAKNDTPIDLKKQAFVLTLIFDEWRHPKYFRRDFERAVFHR
jgi:hypothetical protein